LNDVAAVSADLHANAHVPLTSCVPRPIRTLVSLARRAMRAAAQASRPNRWVAPRAIDPDRIVGSSPGRTAGSRRGWGIIARPAFRGVRLRLAAR